MSKLIHQNVQANDPPIAKLLFSDARLAWVWLIQFW